MTRSHRPLRTALLLTLSLMAGVGSANGQAFPSGRDSGFNERDQVTGYLCVTPGCDVVRMSEASCLCVKQNPNEQRLSKLRLTCTTRQNGAWVACPVKPRYGNGN